MNMFDQIFGWPQSLEEQAQQWQRAARQAHEDAQRHYQELYMRQQAEMQKRQHHQQKQIEDGVVIEGECEVINKENDG